MTGIVSFYNRLRGFGFAIPDDRSQSDVFIHVKSLPSNHRYVNEGDKISYELGAVSKGRPEARKIQIIQEAAASVSGGAK
jgi:CspA family cold shock protein